MIGFDKLAISIRCRNGCGRTFNNKPAESRHALHHCHLNPTKKPRRVNKMPCPKCGKVIFNVSRHLKSCRVNCRVNEL